MQTLEKVDEKFINELGVTTPLTRVMKARDAADFLGVKPDTLNAWRKRGEGPAYMKLSNGRIVYKVNDLVEWSSQKYGAAICFV